MLFGLLSLLMGHWTIFVAKICIKSSVLSSRFYPCASERNGFDSISVSHTHIPFSSNYLNRSLVQEEVKVNLHDFCPEVPLLSLWQTILISQFSMVVTSKMFLFNQPFSMSFRESQCTFVQKHYMEFLLQLWPHETIEASLSSIKSWMIYFCRIVVTFQMCLDLVTSDFLKLTKVFYHKSHLAW